MIVSRPIFSILLQLTFFTSACSTLALTDPENGLESNPEGLPFNVSRETPDQNLSWDSKHLGITELGYIENLILDHNIKYSDHLHGIKNRRSIFRTAANDIKKLYRRKALSKGKNKNNNPLLFSHYKDILKRSYLLGQTDSDQVNVKEVKAVGNISRW